MKFNFSVLFIFLHSFVFSQSEVSGSVTDSLGTPVAYAPIGIFVAADSTVAKGTLTNEKGKFLIDKINPGQYFLKIMAVGFNEKVIENIRLDSISNSSPIYTIHLSRSANTLDGVTVFAVRPVIEFKNSNVIVNVENSPLAKGNSVFDLLSKLPGVSVVDNTVMMQGKTGVTIMIDNRPQHVSGTQLINLLKSMNADLVKTIEILKNPPVKYDASGTSGMINIISKKTTQAGFTATVFSSYSQGFYGQYTAGASLNYQSERMVFYSTLSGSHNYERQTENLKKNFSSDSGSTDLFMANTIKTLNKNLNYKAGLDFILGVRDVIGVKVEGMPGNTDGNSKGRNTVYGANDLGFDHLNSKNISSDNWNATNYEVNYDHKLDTLGSAFSIVGDYTRLTETTSGDNSNNFYDRNELIVLPANNYRSTNKGNSGLFSGRADLKKFINTSSSYEAGLKWSSSEISNNYVFEKFIHLTNAYVGDRDLTNNYTYKESNYAGYLNYVKSFKKLSMQFGSRFEKTFLDGENTGKDFRLRKEYFNVFPNISFDFKESDKHDFQLNLTRRIDRPDFYNLAPFIIFHDQFAYEKGNPFLLPDYANRGEVAYAYESLFATSIAYTYTENAIMGYTSQNDTTKIMAENSKNMKSSSSLELSVYYEKSLTERWDLSASGSFSNKTAKGEIDGVSFNRTGINYFVNASSDFLVTEYAKMELSGSYFGPNMFGIARVKPRWYLSFALNVSMLDERLDLTVGVDDIFYSSLPKSQVNFENQNWTYAQTNDTRRFRVSLNYKFGKMDIKERDIKMSNEEERERSKH